MEILEEISDVPASEKALEPERPLADDGLVSVVKDSSTRELLREPLVIRSGLERIHDRALRGIEGVGDGPGEKVLHGRTHENDGRVDLVGGHEVA
jgi:hypothetical protein